MTTKEFESRVPESACIREIILNFDQVKVALGGPVCTEVKDFILWDETGRSFVRIQADYDEKIIPVVAKNEMVVFRGRLHVRATTYDLKKI